MLADRIAALQRGIADLALYDLETRILRALLRVARARGYEVAEGILLPRRPTQEDLASMVGVRRESVSRGMTALAGRGLITLREGRSLLIAGAVVRQHP
jgi:CRP-like cAMP-binding protein